MTARPLSDDEYDVYSGSATLAVEFIPSFRDAIVLLRPFADFDSECVYVDRYSRICLSKAFFKRSRYQRATTVLHEAMHILNRHFERADAAQMTMSQEFLMSADFEIGTTLVDHPRTDTSHQIVPDREPFSYPSHLTFEQYYSILKPQSSQGHPDASAEGEAEDADGGSSNSEDESSESAGEDESSAEGAQGDSEPQDSSGHNGDPLSTEDSDGEGDSSGGQADKQEQAVQNSDCRPSTLEDEVAADTAGIERASDAETVVARQNTEAAVAEAKKKSLQAGNSAMGAMLERMEFLMQPPKANWRTLLRGIVNRANANIVRGRSDFTYRRPNRRLNYGDFIFPGMQSYKPTTAFGIDTSGSMSKGDFQVTVSEISEILKQTSGGRGIDLFTIDTEIADDPQRVSKISDIVFKGGGGTEMSPAFTYIRELPREARPDIFVLATDGGVPWPPVIDELRKTKKLFKSIILITSEVGFRSVPNELKTLATVIDISK